MSRAQHFRDYLAKKPGDRFAMYSLALELKKANEPGAEAAFQALLALHPHSGAGWYQYGEFLREDEQFERAQVVWNDGLKQLRDANDVEGRRSVSEIQGALDELEDELD